MTAIVIRPEPVSVEDGMQIVAANITGLADDPRRLWYRIETTAQPDGIAVAHALVVSVINAAMALGRDIVVDGPLTRGTVMNLLEYQRIWSASMPALYRRVAIAARELLPDEPFRPERRFVLPFSGGLDSAHSALVLSETRDLGALMPIHGLEITLADTERWTNTVVGLRAYGKSLGVPVLLAATNWQEIAPTLPGYLGFFPPIVAAGLLHAPTYGGTVAASAYPYDSLALPHETSPLTDPLLGRPGFPVLHHGAFAHRIDKVAAVASWPVALKHLRPCDAPTVEGGACARCRKCVQTALAFCALGLPVPPSLGGAPPSIGDIERFEMTPYALLGLRDVLAAARSRNIGAPWLAAVEQRIAAADPMSVGADDVAGLRRRLEHALGGPGGSGPMRFVRRVARAIRGADDPPSAAPVRPVVPAPSPARLFPARPSPATVPAPGFAVSAGGRRLYVVGEDLRGAALKESAGDLFPAALAMWKFLVASGRWTHVVDVGANYGEMIVDLDVGPETRLIAVEPNPRIAACLERSMAEAGRPIELVRKVVCDRDGTAELTIDRTWSGMSSLRVHPVETRGHDLATIQVESATLRSLLADATPDGEKRVAVKIDVEGQELAALRGLEGRATAFGAFAAMIEVRHFDASDFSAVLETFTIDLFDMRSKALVEIADAMPARLLDLLASGDFHPHDAVLRPRT